MTNEINLYKWATENLSAPRARAFHNSLREIENNKFSEELKVTRQYADSLVRAHEVAVREEVIAIQTKANDEMDAIREQIAELQKQIDAIREAANNEMHKVRAAIYRSPEYKAVDEKVCALFQRDDKAVEPLRAALVAKYSKSQEKANA
jgi:hypothetical protein